jgi:hypothetical protein
MMSAVLIATAVDATKPTALPPSSVRSALDSLREVWDGNASVTSRTD